ncbi:MAG TPA: ribosome small subunit-dependent GTPase A [Rhodothermales bacterium]
MEADLRHGTVIRSTGSWYDVQIGDEVVQAKARGRFRLDEAAVTNPVAVGDRVTVRMGDDAGLITEIHERKNKLSRRAAGRRVGQEQIIAANIDAAWFVQSIRLPNVNPGLIDRFLVVAEVHDIPARLVFNKIDLIEDAFRETIEFFVGMYTGLGYPVLVTSALRGDGVSTFRQAIQGRINVVAGPSGVGKSALLNAVAPDLELRTGEVSEKTRKGRHTTTNAALYAIDEATFVVDTPGMREFGIIDLEPAQLSHYFVEFREFIPECRYPNCTHDHEPGCAVWDAVEAGRITEERYQSYTSILESLRLGEKDVGR